MPSRPPRPKGYTRAEIALHWATVALVLFQLIVNDAMRLAFRHRLEEGAMPMALGAAAHVVAGLAVLALTLLRLAIRWRRGMPEPPPGVPALLNGLASLVHMALYVMLLAMPLTGALAWFGGIELAGVAHEAGRLILIGLIALHAFGALFEHFVLETDALSRMLRARGGREHHAEAAVGLPEDAVPASRTTTEEDMDHSRHTPLARQDCTEAVLANAPIYGANDEKIGTISHLHGNGAAATDAVIEVGGFLGIGAKPVLVSLDQLNLMRDENGNVHGVTPWTKDQLKEMPRHYD